MVRVSSLRLRVTMAKLYADALALTVTRRD